MANKIWIGVDPGTKITGVSILEQKKTSLDIYSTTVRPTPKYEKNPNTRLAVLRNGFETRLRRYKDGYNIMGVGIEDPFGVKGNAVVLHELLGLYVVAALDVFGWDTRIYRIPQPSLKKFAINKNVKRDEAMLLMGRRAASDYNYEPPNSDELMAFWCGVFARAIDYDPAEKFRLACIESYKKKRGIE